MKRLFYANFTVYVKFYKIFKVACIFFLTYHKLFNSRNKKQGVPLEIPYLVLDKLNNYYPSSGKTILW
jgi:hypothetical protein